LRLVGEGEETDIFHGPGSGRVIQCHGSIADERPCLVRIIFPVQVIKNVPCWGHCPNEAVSAAGSITRERVALRECVRLWE
jgi:hypothetical protein